MDETSFSYFSMFMIGVTIAIVMATGWFFRKKKLLPPTEWRKVGELNNIFVYPIKSMGYTRETVMKCTYTGLELGRLKDQTIMVLDDDGRLVTARRMPRMVLIKPSLQGAILTLRAPDMEAINVDLAAVSKALENSEIDEDSTPACDCGDDVAQWLSRFLLREDSGLCLVYYPIYVTRRNNKEDVQPWSLSDYFDFGESDITAFSLINEASVADLNTRLEDPVTVSQFRPNFVVKGVAPYEEDTWDWVKIGSATFRRVKLHQRDIFTTIDPNTGKINKNMEPLKTLKTYRLIEDPKYRRSIEDGPVLGIRLGLQGPDGIVKLGDSVYVGVSES